MSKPASLILLALALAAVYMGYRTIAPETAPLADPSGASAERNAAGEAGASLDPVDPAPSKEAEGITDDGSGPVEAPASTGTSEREALAPEGPVVSGVVRGADGQPLANSTVSFTPRTELRDRGTFSAGTWRELRERMAWATSAEDGRFELALAEDGSGVVWATHAGHLAGFVWLEEPRAGVELQLAAAEPITVDVVHMGGGNLAGGALVQRGQPRGPKPIARMTPAERAEQLFLRVHDLTGPEPEVTTRLGATSEGAFVWAEAADGAASLRPRASAGDRLRLELHPSFTLEVTVQGFQPGDAAKAVVIAGDQSYADEVFDLGPDGHRAIQVPLAGAASFVVALASQAHALEGVSFPAPAPGTTVPVTFAARPGVVYPVRFVDAQGDPATDVRVSVVAQGADGSWLNNDIVDVSDADGRADLAGVPAAGPFYFMSMHAGFVDAVHGPFTEADFIPLPPGEVGDGPAFEPLQRVLERTGRVEGQVLQGEERLTTYELFVWASNDSPANRLTVDVEIGADGRFAFEAPVGELYVMAYAEGLPETEPVLVVPGQGAAAEVTLEVGAAATGAGRLVDARTLEAIEGASVTVAVQANGYTLGARPGGGPADELTTDADGRFTVEGLPAERTAMVFLHAPDGRRATAVALPGPDGGFAFGDVLLEAAGSIALRVQGYTGPGELTVTVNYARDQHRELTPDGDAHVATIQGVTTSQVALEVWEDGALLVRRRVRFAGADPLPVTLDVGSGTVLAVGLTQLVDAPRELIVEALGQLPNGARTTYQRFVRAADWEQGAVRLTGLPAGAYCVRAFDERLTMWGLAAVEVADAGEHVVALEPTDRELWLRIVDEAGAPVAGVSVIASEPSTAGTDALAGRTNAEGIANLGRVSFERVDVRMADAQQGFSAWSGVLVPEDAQPVELQLSRSHELRLRVVDGAEPLAGLQLATSFAANGAQAITLTTGADGVFVGGPSDARRYDVWPVASWAWPQPVQVDAVPRGAAPVEVQVRRRGNLRASLIAANGAPAGGLTLKLTDQSTGTDVAQWLTPGGVQAGPGGLVSDASGAVSLDGLPHGEYAWSVPAIGTSGSLTVPPLGTATVQLGG